MGDIISGIVSEVSGAIILFLIALIFLDQKKVLRPWVYKVIKPDFRWLTGIILGFVNFISSPWTRVALIQILSFWIILSSDHKNIASLLVVFLVPTFLFNQKDGVESRPAAKVNDGFEIIDPKRWFKKTGNPIIESSFGKPAPDLGLEKVSGRATNSFLIMKNVKPNRGIIECDFFLEPRALLNIVFYGDFENDNWIMARYDSRQRCSDGFLLKEGQNWSSYAMSGTQTVAKTWHRARVEFSRQRIVMYKDGKLIVEMENPKIQGNSVGIFNEVEHVHLDNFYLAELKQGR